MWQSPVPPLDMTIVGPVRVQHTTTSAAKLDPPLSQLIKGCWDAITIKAGPLQNYHLSLHPTAPLTSICLSKKSLPPIFPSQYSHIAPLCPAILGLRCEQQSLNFQSFDDFYVVWLQRTFTMELDSPSKDSCKKYIMPRKLKSPKSH